MVRAPGPADPALVSCGAVVMWSRAARRAVPAPFSVRRPQPPSLPRLRRRPGGRLRVALAASAAALLAGGLAGIGGDRHASADFARAGDLAGLHAGRVWALAVDPASANTVLAATDAGVLVTSDRGANWQATSLRGTRAWTVGFDARADAKGAHTAYAGLQEGGFARSDDRLRWTDASAGLVNRNVRVLAIGLSGIAVGTDDGVEVSSDGRTWRTAGLRGYSVSALAVSANAPAFTLVAGTDSGPPGGGAGFLFRNAGPGPTWEPLSSGLPATAVVSAVAAGPLPQSTMARPLVVGTDKGAFRSGDGGSTWTASAGPPGDTGGVPTLTVTTAVFSPVDPNLVYAGNDSAGSSGGEIYRSTDGGATFSPADRGLGDGQKNVASLAVAATTPPLVMVGIDPPGGGALIFTETDATAPPPGAIAAESGAALQTAAPVPSVAPTASPAPGGPLPSTGHGGLRGFYDRLVGWPFPLSVELLVILAAAYFGFRWYQRRLDIEGPP